MHRHLVTVEVGVEGSTDQGVNLNGLTFNQLRFECLNTQAVQRRCTVQQHWVLSDDFLENVPHDRTCTLNHALGTLDVLGVVEVNQALHHERLEQFQRHLLRQTTLVQLELRTNHDDRTARVVHALSEQVLAETTLLALEHVGERLQRAVARSSDRTTTTTVVEQSVNRFLQHALFVVHDDLGGTEVKQTLQTVVAVDHTTVEVVEVRGGKTSTIKLHHRTQVRRDDRNAVQDHARGAIGRSEECGNDLEALKGAGLLLSLAVLHDVAELLRFGFQVKGFKATLDGSSTHATFEVTTKAIAHFAIQHFVAFKVLNLQGLEAVKNAINTVDLVVGTTANRCHLALCTFAHLAANIGLGAFGFQLSEVRFELLRTLIDVDIALLGDLFLLERDLLLVVRKILVTSVFVHAGDHVSREVDDLFQVLRSKVEEVAQTRRNTLEVPDVSYWSRKFDVTHALTTNLGAGDFNTATLTDDALEAHSLVLTAVALPVASRSEDLLAEQAILLRLEGAVVDGLRLLNFAMRPQADVIGSS